MIVNKTIAATMDQLNLHRQKGLSIGLVPTMGALHEGHLSLIRRARAENDIVVCSIFVNPIQFNNKEDLAKYPRTLEADTALLESENCDIIFAPEVNEIYPNNNEPITVYDLEGLDKPMEGQFRPGHFQGVCVIVHKLFNIVNPDRAYFGNKDFQQLAIIRNMVKKQKLNLEIVGCDIIREKDGLAMSSRNMRLTESERLIAPKIYQTLLQAKNKIADYKNTLFTPALLKQWISDEISSNEPLKPEYVEIVDTISLQPTEDWNGGKTLIVCVAVFDGSVRLIDNLILFS
ncbi:MAG: pantoate--beta-alanine ligase [Bacteroidetes bacterium]|nr:pantoate--beta-alanine ligase [Bacteroidota bacterium]